MKTVRGRLTILTDNMVLGRNEAIGEHGFSANLETEKGSFLLDTGNGKTISHNALYYKKDLKIINKIVLSHSHGDHNGGLPEVLRAQAEKQIDVYAHPDIFLDRFRKKNGQKTYGVFPSQKGIWKRWALVLCSTKNMRKSRRVFS